MVRLFFISAAFFIVLNSAGHAWNSIDEFVNMHCGGRCNGDSTDCTICYNEAVDLYDQATPDSPEVNWGFSGGKLEFDF